MIRRRKALRDLHRRAIRVSDALLSMFLRTVGTLADVARDAGEDLVQAEALVYGATFRVDWDAAPRSVPELMKAMHYRGAAVDPQTAADALIAAGTERADRQRIIQLITEKGVIGRRREIVASKCAGDSPSRMWSWIRDSILYRVSLGMIISLIAAVLVVSLQEAIPAGTQDGLEAVGYLLTGGAFMTMAASMYAVFHVRFLASPGWSYTRPALDFVYMIVFVVLFWLPMCNLRLLFPAVVSLLWLGFFRVTLGRLEVLRHLLALGELASDPRWRVRYRLRRLRDIDRFVVYSHFIQGMRANPFGEVPAPSHLTFWALMALLGVVGWFLWLGVWLIDQRAWLGFWGSWGVNIFAPASVLILSLVFARLATRFCADFSPEDPGGRLDCGFMRVLRRLESTDFFGAELDRRALLP